jgi:hypothetical protein
MRNACKHLLPISQIAIRDSAHGGSGSVLSTGRYFGRKTQKWPHKNLSGRKFLRANFLQICLKIAEKWPNLFEGYSSLKNLDYLQK